MTDVMGDFAFGEKIGMTSDSNLDFILAIFGNYSWRMGVYDQFPRLASVQLEKLVPLLRGQTNLGKKWKEWCDNFSSIVLDGAIHDRKGRFSLLVNSKDPATGQSPSREELWADGAFLMLSGKVVMDGFLICGAADILQVQIPVRLLFAPPFSI